VSEALPDMAGPRRKCSPKKGGAKIGSKAKREENAMEDSAQRKGEDLETRLAEHLQVFAFRLDSLDSCFLCCARLTQRGSFAADSVRFASR
jgi:hypothetical protein